MKIKIGKKILTFSTRAFLFFIVLVGVGIAGSIGSKNYSFHDFDVYIDSLLSAKEANITTMNITRDGFVGASIVFDGSEGNVSATYLAGSIQCDQITGGDDGDYCTDADSGAVTTIAFWKDDGDVLSLNASIADSLNITNRINMSGTIGEMNLTTVRASAFYDDTVLLANYDDTNVRASIVNNRTVIETSITNNMTGVIRNGTAATFSLVNTTIMNVTDRINFLSGSYMATDSSGNIDIY